MSQRRQKNHNVMSMTEPRAAFGSNIPVAGLITLTVGTIKPRHLLIPVILLYPVLPGFRPIPSSGNLCLAKNNGIWWTTTSRYFDPQQHPTELGFDPFCIWNTGERLEKSAWNNRKKSIWEAGLNRWRAVLDAAWLNPTDLGCFLCKISFREACTSRFEKWSWEVKGRFVFLY